MMPVLRSSENAESMACIYSEKEVILASRFFLISQVDLLDIMDIIWLDESDRERF